MEEPSPSRYKFELTTQPNPQQSKEIWEGLRDSNLGFVPLPEHTPLVITVCNQAEQIAGGLVGGFSWNWLHVDALWLSEDLRGQGFGRQLMEMAEAEARQHGCNHAMVDTFDFQAPGFYTKLGYVAWGVLDDFPGGHQRIYFRKDL